MPLHFHGNLQGVHSLYIRNSQNYLQHLVHIKSRLAIYKYSNNNGDEQCMLKTYKSFHFEILLILRIIFSFTTCGKCI